MELVWSTVHVNSMRHTEWETRISIPPCGFVLAPKDAEKSVLQTALLTFTLYNRPPRFQTLGTTRCIRVTESEREIETMTIQNPGISVMYLSPFLCK